MILGLANIVLVPIYTRTLQPEQYGVVDYLVVVQNLIQVCAGLEIAQGIARFYASTDDADDRQAFASTGLIFLLSSVAMVCGLVWAAAAGARNGALGLDLSAAQLALALGAIFARILFYALQGQLRWELRSGAYSVAGLVAVVSMIGLTSYLLIVAHTGLTGVFVGTMLGYGAGCLACLVALRRTYRLTFDRRKLRDMLGFSAPLTASTLALLLANYGDRLVLRSELGFHDLGIYGVAARFGAVVTLAIAGFQLGAAPLIYRHFEEPGTPATLAQLLRFFLAVGAAVVIGLAAYSIELVGIFATAEYADAWRPMPLLSLAIVMGSLYTFTPGLSVRNMTGRFAGINIVIGIISFSFVWLLTRRFGMLGAAVGSLAGATTGFILHALASQSVYRMPLSARCLAGALLTTLSAIGACQWIGTGDADSLVMRTGIFAVALPALMLLGLTADDRSMATRLALAGFGRARLMMTAGGSR